MPQQLKKNASHVLRSKREQISPSERGSYGSTLDVTGQNLASIPHGKSSPYLVGSTNSGGTVSMPELNSGGNSHKQ